MSKKDLKFFMRDLAEEIVTAPAPASFVDDEGNPIEMQIRVLPAARIQEIFAKYKNRRVATNAKGAPYLLPSGDVAWQTEKDNARAFRHIIAEALVYPDLQDKELMAHYNCVDLTEMPLKVFSRSDEYNHVSQVVSSALGLDGSSDEELVEEAKN